MDDVFNHDPLRDRLIVAGIAEIGQHGVGGFSLRRVAAACNTSCAAPYKHFKNKDDLILEIIRFVNRQWELLRDQVLALHPGDDAERIVEVCVAYIRFWVANPNYRFALKAPGYEYSAAEITEKPDDPKTIENLVRVYCDNMSADEEETERKVCAVKAILYGMTTMLDDGELQNTPQAYDRIRRTVRIELSV
jgi:AcrR family transcriptional regulator